MIIEKLNKPLLFFACWLQLILCIDQTKGRTRLSEYSIQPEMN